MSPIIVVSLPPPKTVSARVLLGVGSSSSFVSIMLSDVILTVIFDNILGYFGPPLGMSQNITTSSYPDYLLSRLFC